MTVKITISASDGADSNILLRAIWAALRREFGKLAWQFMPRRDGERKVIHFGMADVGLTEPLAVAIEYKQKGVVAAITFENADAFADRLRACVRRAHETAGKPEVVALKTTLTTTLQATFADKATENVVLASSEPTTANLVVRLPAFDKEDGRVEFAKRVRPITDALAAFTNLPVSPADPSEHEPGIGKVRTPSQEVAPDWIDDHPVVDGLLVLPDAALKLLQAIALGKLNNGQQLLLDASHHFHAGLVVEGPAMPAGETAWLPSWRRCCTSRPSRSRRWSALRRPKRAVVAARRSTASGSECGASS